MSKTMRGFRRSKTGNKGSKIDDIQPEEVERALRLKEPPIKSNALSEPSYTGQRNVFISFSMKDENQVQLLRAQTKNDKQELRFRDYSAKEPFSQRWKTQMEKKMKRCSTTICMIGKDTHKREAVTWELNKAYELGHKVIGVKVYRDANHTIPKPLKDNNAKIITWTLTDIMEQLNTI